MSQSDGDPPGRAKPYNVQKDKKPLDWNKQGSTLPKQKGSAIFGPTFVL